MEDLCVPTFFFSHFLGHFDEMSWKIEVVIVGTPPRAHVAHHLYPDQLYLCPPRGTRGTPALSGSHKGAHDTLKYYTWTVLYFIRIHCPDH